MICLVGEVDSFGLPCIYHFYDVDSKVPPLPTRFFINFLQKFLHFLYPATTSLVRMSELVGEVAHVRS
jgi:hypothetical protein